jgi:transcriptional regulator with XRE-family HTH domain
MATDPVAVLRRLVKKYGTQRAAAVRLGVSASYLGEILKGTRPPGPTILQALRLKRKTVYTR